VSGVLPCPGGEEMSRICLYYTQPALYQFIYTLHFFGLGWIILHFVTDLLHLPTWCVEIWQGRGTVSMFYLQGCGCGHMQGDDIRGCRCSIGAHSYSTTTRSGGKQSAHSGAGTGADAGADADAGAVAGAGAAADRDTDNMHANKSQNLAKCTFNYFSWLLLMWLFVTLTWTVFVDWSTGDKDGVQGLAAIEIIQILGYNALICSYYYWWRE